MVRAMKTIETHLLKPILKLIDESATLDSSQKDSLRRILDGGGLHGVEMDEYILATEAAKRLSVAVTTIMEWARWGDVRSKRLGRRVTLIHWGDAVAYDATSRGHKQRRRHL